MNEKLKYFCYSQNSINTYKSCPMKFKYKYIDKINWKHDDIESRSYYEGLELGRDFHLMCERYFNNIPIGIYIDADKPDENKIKFKKWINKVQKLIPIKEGSIYLPEYEIRYNLDGYNIQAKYDLVIIDDNNIEIWDWKTESRKIDYKNVENRIQTIVYMFLATEVIPRLENINIDSEKICMKYYQPEFDNEAISISYSDEKHILNKNKILSYIKMTVENNYDNKNKNHCKYCEFNKLCNGTDIDYNILEEKNYGT
ncbi:MAG: PD-(D/E)XK nuclease family protein [Romboutsia sp.]